MVEMRMTCDQEVARLELWTSVTQNWLGLFLPLFPLFSYSAFTEWLQTLMWKERVSVFMRCGHSSILMSQHKARTLWLPTRTWDIGSTAQLDSKWKWGNRGDFNTQSTWYQMKHKKREIIVNQIKYHRWLPRVSKQDVNLYQDFSYSGIIWSKFPLFHLKKGMASISYLMLSNCITKISIAIEEWMLGNLLVTWVIYIVKQKI